MKRIQTFKDIQYFDLNNTNINNAYRYLLCRAIAHNIATSEAPFIARPSLTIKFVIGIAFGQVIYIFHTWH